jgi:hypothetical protein
MDEKKISTYTEDLSFDYKDPNAPAMFMPSMSRNYVAYASAYEKKMTDDRHPKGIHRDGRELNIFQKDNGCYFYPYALTSAGHANLDIDHAALNDREGIFRTRDRSNSVIVGDSGGYQIGKGILKFDWKNFESEENNILRMKILKWLESIADLSMTLDVPVWGIDEGLEGVETFEDCLEKTMINHDFFIKHRTPGATRFMNILHGRNKAEGDLWWDAAKDLPFEGWAFAGVNMCNFELIMRRLIIMRDEGYLDKERNWIHFLGVSRLTSACAFSAIQRNIRKHVEPTFTISYDASSPFLSTAHGRWYTKLTYSQNNMNYTMDQVIDNKDLYQSKLPFPLLTPIGKKLTMGDLSVKGHDVDSKSSWDSWSYMFIMNHNMYMHIRGINEANTLYQLPRPHAADYIVPEVLEFRDLCEEIFTTSKPMELIKSNSKLLMNLSGTKTENKKRNAFDTSRLFEVEGTHLGMKVEYNDEHNFDDSFLEE